MYVPPVYIYMYIYILILLLIIINIIFFNGQDEIRTHKMINIRRLAIGYTSPVAACPCSCFLFIVLYFLFIF